MYNLIYAFGYILIQTQVQMEEIYIANFKNAICMQP